MRRLDSSVNQGPHAERLELNPGNAPDGALWVETDRGNVVYQVQADEDGEPVWVYLSGTMTALLADKPPDLGVNDSGLLFYGTDYAHTWRWIGSTWQYAPGDRIAGEIAWFTADPGTGWKLCDGSAVTRTTAGAGTAAITMPNLIGAYAKGAASYSGAVVPASAGTISGNTADESSHIHRIDHDHPPVTTSAAGLSSTFQGGPFNSVNENHTHTVDIPIYIGNSDAGSAHHHGAGTLAVSAGEPAHVGLLPYFRI